MKKWLKGLGQFSLIFVLAMLAMIEQQLSANEVNLKCVDLSHEQPLGIGNVLRQQVGCEKFIDKYVIDEGDILWEKEWEITGKWDSVSVDDEHEAYKADHRWIWSQDGKVLFHDYTIDGYDKYRKQKYYKTSIKSYFKEKEDKVTVKDVSTFRLEDDQGKVESGSNIRVEELQAIRP